MIIMMIINQILSNLRLVGDDPYDLQTKTRKITDFGDCRQGFRLNVIASAHQRATPLHLISLESVITFFSLLASKVQLFLCHICALT